ncbi:hypothetical protein DSM112329_02129 [Paraconexibacter sp. AEG42_29]|uniref:DUF4430 domain-containing protein n=1 Tax=Paraconexibacter sp. AEG42_29 TaxID=2997339 RepID=A0AAU7AUA3_9ACTN
MSGRTRRGVQVPAAAGVLLAVLALAGCGGDQEGAGAQLVVTQDFGTRSIADLPQPTTRPGSTILELLSANVPGVRTATIAAQPQLSAVGPVTNATVDGRTKRWTLFVNGVGEDAEGPGQELDDNDVVWWDHHDTGAAARVPAVVGSFPAPFRNGVEGKRMPLRIECSPADIPACQKVQDAMTAAGVFAAQGGLQQSITDETLRIIVGPWERIRDDDTARLLEGGPRVSGVYARPTPDGRSIALLDATGKQTRELGPGSGLIAATRLRDGQPVWFITGPDVAGVSAAAQALDQGNLKDHYALAVDDGRAVAVPEVGVAVRP